MKKKIITLSLLMVLFMTFVSCDFLSTLNAVKGFYTEYTEFNEVYNNATQYTVLTETELIISDTNIESIVPQDTRVYFMYDQDSDFLYVEQNLEGVDRVSLYEENSELYVEYVIVGDVVTPTAPAEEDQYGGSTDANFLNDNFSYEDVTNENKTGDRTYTLDVVLTQAINLDALGDFVDQLKVFDEDLSVLNDVIAHLTITFDSVDSTIDVTAVVEEYQIVFEDESSVTFSLNNHTVVKSPEDFAFPNVFAAPYQMVAVDDIDLARRTYIHDEVINYPAVSGENGWVKLELVPGIYGLESALASNFTAVLYDESEVMVEMTIVDLYIAQVTIVDGGTYYLYISPIADFQSDITMVLIEDHSPITTTATITTETPVTTAPVTTETPVTTEAAA
ncbi:hypothetical protein RJI07_09045 [Mycoplasmatota bacterium WC30]